MDKISFIIPCYNYGMYLRKCIRSVLNQRLNDEKIEIIVVNDGSNDDTEQVCKEFGSRIKYIKQRNRGLSSARNRGIDAATGDYIVFLDADDLLLPNYIISQLKAVREFKTDIVICQHIPMLSFDVDGPLFQVENRWPLVRRAPEIHLCHFNIAPPHCYMIRAGLVAKVGYFDEQLRACEDYDFWLRCLINGGRIHVNPEVGVIYRKHHLSMSKNLYNQYFHDYIMHKRLLNFLPDIKAISGEIPLAWISYSAGCLVTAKRFINLKRYIARDLMKIVIKVLSSLKKGFFTKYQGICRYYLSKIYVSLAYLNNFEPLLCRSIEELIKGYDSDLSSENAIDQERKNYHSEHFTTSSLVIFKEQNTYKRILLASDFFLPSIGGTELFTYELAKELKRKGYEVHVVTRYLENRRSFRIDGIDILQFQCFDSIDCNFNGSELTDYLWFLRLNKYRCMFIIGQPDLWLHTALLMQENLEYPVFLLPIINTELLNKWKSNQALLNGVAFILRKANKCISLTSAGIDFNFIKNLGINPLYIPHALRLPSPKAGFRQRYNFSETKPLIIHVGNFWPIKNQLGLVKVLRNTEEDCNIAFIGKRLPWPKEAEYYEAVIEAAKGDNRFHFLGGLSPEEANSGIAEADILLLPSLGECRPLVILQAMGYGTPWIATPECNSVMEDQGGVVCSLDEFPVVIREILRYNSFRQMLKESGKKHFEKVHTWDVVLPKFLSLIENI